MNENESILRGEIYWTKHKPHRPVVVVSNNDINETTDSVLVVPMTSNPTNDRNTHCAIRVGGCSTALAERIRPMKKTDLGKFIDFTSVSEMMQLDFCLINALSLDYLFDELGQADRNTNAATEAVSPEVNNATMATTPEEEDKPLAVVIVEGESERRVLRESEVVRSRSELKQIIDEATKSTPPEQSEPEPEPVRTGRFTHGTVDPAISVIKTGDEPEEVKDEIFEEDRKIEDPTIRNDVDDLVGLIERCTELETELANAHAREELLEKMYNQLLHIIVG